MSGGGSGTVSPVTGTGRVGNGPLGTGTSGVGVCVGAGTPEPVGGVCEGHSTGGLTCCVGVATAAFAGRGGEVAPVRTTELAAGRSSSARRKNGSVPCAC